MNTIRCKFQVVSVTDNGPGVPKTVKLSARYDASLPEDQRFQKATPWGDFSANIDNPVALEQLTIGKSFYLDLVPVD